MWCNVRKPQSRGVQPATVVGATVVGATVVGATVVGATVVGYTTVDGIVVIAKKTIGYKIMVLTFDIQKNIYLCIYIYFYTPQSQMIKYSRFPGEGYDTTEVTARNS